MLFLRPAIHWPRAKSIAGKARTYRGGLLRVVEGIPGKARSYKGAVGTCRNG